MDIKITDANLIDKIETQAKAQNTTPDKLIERILKYCMELRLIESVGITQNEEEWASGPVI